MHAQPVVEIFWGSEMIMAGMVRLSLLVNLSEVRSIILKLLRMWLLVQLLNGSYNQKVTKSTKGTFLIPLKSLFV
ncbi:MAG: hypothetical protein A2079_05245 [Geobacteraceae bacterium GWC2_48_7]|nr:MAG: hypothetical protein A2079_05245 [Geobacteraceae bacterium GWC2_48_7]